MSALRPTHHVRAAAFVSAVSLAVFVFIQQAANAIVQAIPGVFVPLAVVWDLALWLWTLGLAVTVFGGSSAGRTAVAARAAASAAFIAPALLAYGQASGSFGSLVPLAYLVIFVAAGLAMVADNAGSWVHRSSSRARSALGAFAGVAYVLGGLGGIGFLGLPLLIALAAIGLQVLMLAHALYIVWAIWLGARSAHTVAPALAAA